MGKDPRPGQGWGNHQYLGPAGNNHTNAAKGGKSGCGWATMIAFAGMVAGFAYLANLVVGVVA